MPGHIPVLLNETIKFLEPGSGKKYIDATLGRAGHTAALLEAGASVLGIDADPKAIADLSIANERFTIAQGNFSEIERIATEHGFTEVDGILFDLGLGSHQLDEGERGFSFQNDGPLDMRFDQTATVRGRPGRTAADILSLYSEKELFALFRNYGDENRFGRRIARAIMEFRKHATLRTTGELFELIKHTLPGKLRFKAGDTARKIFQALRIETNSELENLEKGLQQAVQLLKKGSGGGRLVVISFHSLEDRIAKKFFLKESRDCTCPPSFPVCICAAKANLRILTRKPITASVEELETNPRAHSAKLRVAERV